MFPSDFRKRPESFGVSFAIVSSIVPTACAGSSRDSNAVLSIPHFLQNKQCRFLSRDSFVNDVSRDADKDAEKRPFMKPTVYAKHSPC